MIDIGTTNTFVLLIHKAPVYSLAKLWVSCSPWVPYAEPPISIACPSKIITPSLRPKKFNVNLHERLQMIKRILNIKVNSRFHDAACILYSIMNYSFPIWRTVKRKYYSSQWRHLQGSMISNTKACSNEIYPKDHSQSLLQFVRRHSNPEHYNGKRWFCRNNWSRNYLNRSCRMETLQHSNFLWHLYRSERD